MSGLHVLWFKHDLRVHDHAALRAACQDAERDGGQVMALFVWPEPSMLGQKAERGDGVFLEEALSDLRRALDQRGAVLHIRAGSILDILSDLHAQHQVLSLHHHHDGPTDETLRRLEAWSLRAGVRVNYYRQRSPVRAPRDRTPAQTLWEQFMARPRHEAPDTIPSANVGVGNWPDVPETGSDSNDQAIGGRKAAIRRLRAFLSAATSEAPDRQSARSAFNDLAPHIQLGTVSLREVWQAAIGSHQQALKSGLDIRAASIATFLHTLPTLSEAIAPVPSNAAGTIASRARRSKQVGDQLSLGLGDPSAGTPARN